MQSKLDELRNRINELDALIENGGPDAVLNLLEMERTEKRNEVASILAEEANQQATTESAGFIFDTLEVDGLTMPEIITDDSQYNLARKGVQNLVVTLTTNHSTAINALKDEYRQEVETWKEFASAESLRADQMQGDNTDLEVANYQLGLEKDELSEKVRKIAQIQHESDQQIEQQKQHIQDLQTQISVGIRGALNVVNIPQDTTALAAEIIASKPRIINVRFKDENGIDTRIKRAENVLTGDTFEYEALYEKRYIILNAEQAEQYKADEANKKAELEKQNDSIPYVAEAIIEPVNAVTETEETATDQPFPESNQVSDAKLTVVEGSPISDREVSAEESQINEQELFFAMPATMGDIAKVKEQMNYLNNRLDETAVRLDIIEGHKAVA